ncbi:MAG: hypothetical protein AAF718_13450 [Pseudomonadota bacterium]
MAKVNLDIAGFYYRFFEVEVDDGSPVKALMDAVNNVIVPVGNGGSVGAKLTFDTEDLGKKVFIDSISITHAGGSAKSGQKDDAGSYSTRAYPDGIYANADEAGIIKEDLPTKPFVALDRNKTGLMAWQYYVYDTNFVDLNRKFGPRKVVPFTEIFERNDEGQPPRGLQNGDTVVWRLVQIRTRPDGGIGPQTMTMNAEVV